MNFDRTLTTCGHEIFPCGVDAGAAPGAAPASTPQGKRSAASAEESMKKIRQQYPQDGESLQVHIFLSLHTVWYGSVS